MIVRRVVVFEWLSTRGFLRLDGPEYFQGRGIITPGL